jgi:hypothetical protein
MDSRFAGTLLGRALRRLRADEPGGTSSAEAGPSPSAPPVEPAVDAEELAALRRELTRELDRLAARTAGEATPSRR